jgi:hypothetical protein
MGYFEIGALLSVKDNWQRADHFSHPDGRRGVSPYKTAFSDGLTAIAGKLENSLETERLQNDFLTGSSRHRGSHTERANVSDHLKT